MNSSGHSFPESYEIPNKVNETVPNPKISVITLTYNHRPYIEQCIKSVLEQQTSYPFEYLIGEDFSEDGTREIVMKYAEKHPGIIRVITSDSNIGGRFNAHRMFDAARAPYIALCEGDDYWTDPDKLQKQLSFMEKNPKCHISFHATKFNYVNDDSLPETIVRAADKNKIFTVDEVIMGGGNFITTASIMIRKEATKRLSHRLKTRPAGDFYIQIAGSINGGALYLNEVMSVYRKGVKKSWSDRAPTIKSRILRELILCNKLRNLDKATDYEYHRAFRRREKKALRGYLKKLYSFDKLTIAEVKQIIDKKASDTLKLECYKIMVLSFMYHKMGIKQLIGRCK